MTIEIRAGQTKICLTKGDITRHQVDAIVNAANSSLLGGGGVDGAIHRAGGPSILEECRQIRAMQGQCRPGQCVITGGGNLPVKFVIHTVGPIWRGGATDEAATLANAYTNSLELAVQYEIKTIAFPAISTGAYGYPINEAAAIAISTVSNFCQTHASIEEVRFVVFDEFNLRAYEEILSKS
jgi:O-acetyl-ADP-ribose deacetylase (regulator of RNase III)